MRIKDIRITEEFLVDWARAPEVIRSRLDRKVISMGRCIAERGWTEVPNSFNAHKVSYIRSAVWIGYVSHSRQAYRLLFEIDAGGTMVLLNLHSHTENEMYLKNLRWELDRERE